MDKIKKKYITLLICLAIGSFLNVIAFRLTRHSEGYYTDSRGSLCMNTNEEFPFSIKLEGGLPIKVTKKYTGDYVNCIDPESLRELVIQNDNLKYVYTWQFFVNEIIWAGLIFGSFRIGKKVYANNRH